MKSRSFHNSTKADRSSAASSSGVFGGINAVRNIATIGSVDARSTSYVKQAGPARQRSVRELPFVLKDPGFDLVEAAIGRDRPVFESQQIERERLVECVAVLRVERKRLELIRLHDIGRDLEPRRCVLARIRNQRLLDCGEHQEI